MPDAENQHQEPVILNLTDEPEIAHAVLPEFPQWRTLKCLSHATRIVQLGDAPVKEFQDSSGVLRVELVQFNGGALASGEFASCKGQKK
jgi:hypothetical protein